MADEITMLTGFVKTASGTFYDFFIYTMLFLVVATAIFFYFYFKGFKHEVVIRYITKNRKMIIRDKAKPRIIDGVPTWQLLKMRKHVKPPQPGALEITTKGRYFAECYWTQDNPEPVWLEDKGEPVDAFTKYAYTTDERAYAVAQHQKALARKKKSLWEQIKEVVMPVSMVIMVAIPFIFFGNLTEESTKQAQANLEQARINADVTAQNARLMSILSGKVEIGELVVSQSIPPDAGVTS